MQECKNIEIFKSVKNDLGAANFKRNKITQNGTQVFMCKQLLINSSCKLQSVIAAHEV